MAFKEYGNYDAVGLAELVRKKQVSAAELLGEAMTRLAIANHDGGLGFDLLVANGAQERERGLLSVSDANSKSGPSGTFERLLSLPQALDPLSGVSTYYDSRMPEARILRLFNRVGRFDLPTHRLSSDDESPSLRSDRALRSCR